ncbi:EamA family transporter [Thiospirochaeta perfilievii]|uniref:EamA family transporter n=1 Tax=Thiospirochaeta perfilievii TaxID=252967 RepID=A0A5C1QB41_9SPIO|nr:EamA family transporter [Thiospirochaeta perfilievii]
MKLVKYRFPSWLLALFACLLWSTAFVGVKYSITFAPPLFVAGIRFFLAGLILIPFAGEGYFKEIQGHFKLIVIVGFLQTFSVYLLFFLSLSRIKASTGAALVGLGPLIGAVLGHVFIKTDKFNRKKIISFILGISGVTLVSLSGGKNGSLPNNNVYSKLPSWRYK